MESGQCLRQTELRATVRPGQQHRLQRLLVEWFAAVPHDGATAIVVVLDADDVVEKEAFVEQVEQLYGRLMDHDPGTAGVEQCHIQHGHVVTRVLPVDSSNLSHYCLHTVYLLFFITV